MLVAFSLIFVGIKKYRDQHGEGYISFGKGFKIGLLITLIASTIYVITWLIDYYYFMPDFMEILPVGLIVTLISAAILKRKKL